MRKQHVQKKKRCNIRMCVCEGYIWRWSTAPRHFGLDLYWTYVPASARGEGSMARDRDHSLPPVAWDSSLG